MHIRVQRPNQDVVTIELSGEWRVEPVERHCLVGPDTVHFFTPEGYYDHEEPRPEPENPREPLPRREPTPLNVGPSDGGSCVP
jgi:hypothetical protein